MFTIFPAIDLRHGRVVRLEEGRDDRLTEYGDDAVARARTFESEGAQALHVVDLDAAFGDGSNKELIREIVQSVDLPVQVGGGIRDTGIVESLLETGVRRLIIGSAAISNPEWVGELAEAYGDRIVVGIDAKAGEVKTHGWVAGSGKSVTDVARQMSSLGVKRVVYTDISRDGMLSGPDISGSAALAREADIEVVISGGVGGIEHVEAAAAAGKEDPRVVGLIIGKAIYEGKVSLQKSLEVAGC